MVNITKGVIRYIGVHQVDLTSGLALIWKIRLISFIVICQV